MMHSGPVRSALPYVAAAVSAWYLYKLLIKPFLSPLRKIPGRSYKPIIGNMFEALRAEAMDNSINWMKNCKSRIIRFYFLYGEGRVLIADPALVKRVMVSNSKNYIHLTASNLNQIVPGFLLTLNGEEHHALRKLLNPPFNSQSVNEFIPAFEETSRTVIGFWSEQLEKGQGTTVVEAQNFMARLTLDGICRCGFDYQMRSVEEPTSAGVLSFQRILNGIQLRLSQMLPLQQWLPTKRNRQMWSDLKFFSATIENVISAKLKKLKSGEGGTGSKDLLGLLLQARDENGKMLSQKSLAAQVGGFLFAGYETTSMTLTWTLLMLAEHPEVQEKARQEVKLLLSDKGQAVTTKTVDSLNYLTCVIKETLRILPPVPMIFRKAVRDDYLGGYLIPAGTPVGVSVGALHRLPENWTDPLTFRPERFQEDYDHYAYLPFSAGPYMCIGHIFSMVEAKVALALLLRHFQFSLPEGYKYRRIRRITMQPSPPLILNISAVN